MQGNYPQAAKQVEIPKLKGGICKLGISIVTDRIIQQAIAQVLNSKFRGWFNYLNTPRVKLIS